MSSLETALLIWEDAQRQGEQLTKVACHQMRMEHLRTKALLDDFRYADLATPQTPCPYCGTTHAQDGRCVSCGAPMRTVPAVRDNTYMATLYAEFPANPR